MERKLFVVFCAALFAGLFAGIAGGEETVLQQDTGIITLSMFPNPEDTIIYDSPPPIWVIPEPFPYWAVRFTPAGLCTVKAGLVSVSIVSGSPICSLYVMDDSAGAPGPPVGGTPIGFSATGYPTFDRIDLTSTYVDSNDFWIVLFPANKAPDVARPLSDSVTTWGRSYFSPDLKNWFDFSSTDPPIPGDLLIRAIVEYPQPATPDVAVDSIIAPPDTVPCLTQAAVSARVCNVGDTMATFDVEALIPGLYGDTVTSVSLDISECTTVDFANWVVPDSHGVCFDVQFRTLLAIDTNPLNDTLSTQSCAYCPASPDVAVDSIIAPPDTVPCLTQAAVSARVCNVGDTTVIFDVEALIPGFYGDTITAVTLTPGICSTLTFANWVVPDSHGVCFDVQFRTLLAIDTDPTNDTMSTTSCAWCLSYPDVAVDSIIAPPDTVPCLAQAAVSARVCNVGDTTATFDVEALIPGLYGDTIMALTLTPGICSTLTFVNWVVPDSHGVCFDVQFRTLLAIDTDPTNDTMSILSCAWCPPSFRDVGVISVDDPPDTVYADSTVPVAVTVANFGDSTETSFAVSITIDGYSDVDLVASLAPGETLQIVFDSLTVPSPCETTYTATAINLLGPDQNPANDTLRKDIYAKCPEGIAQEFLSHVPRSFALLQSRPNPFSTSTEILYQLPAEARVSLNIYDTAGRLVRSLVNGVEEPGVRRTLWDGGDEHGRAVKSGVYFYKLQVYAGSRGEEFTQTRKLILLR